MGKLDSNDICVHMRIISLEDLFTDSEFRFFFLGVTFGKFSLRSDPGQTWGGVGWVQLVSSRGNSKGSSGRSYIACAYKSGVKIFIWLALWGEGRMEKVFLLQAAETSSWQHRMVQIFLLQ